MSPIHGIVVLLPRNEEIYAYNTCRFGSRFVCQDRRRHGSEDAHTHQLAVRERQLPRCSRLHHRTSRPLPCRHRSAQGGSCGMAERIVEDGAGRRGSNRHPPAADHSEDSKHNRPLRAKHARRETRLAAGTLRCHVRRGEDDTNASEAGAKAVK